MATPHPRDPSPPKQPAQPPQPPRRGVGWLWPLLLLVGLFVVVDQFSRAGEPTGMPYSEFRQLVQAGKIESADVGAQQILFVLKEEQEGRKTFSTVPVPDDELVAILDKAGVKYTGIPPEEGSFFGTLLLWTLPLLLLFLFWGFLARRMMGGGRSGPGLMSIGRSKAKIYVETDTRVSFQDVAGVDEAKEELKEVVSFLKSPQSYGRLGARMPKGVLLVGPPGTGKTLLARAVAGEAGVPFFSISGSEFVEMFVGVGAARVRDLFEQARQKAPCIIFIDELDALGRARMAGGIGGGGHDEKEQTLNQLLVEMDGFDASSGLVLLAATNRPEILDPALLRAGRFDRHVLVDRPDKKGREEILKVHVKRIKLEKDVELDRIAALTPGFTGADLANLANEAAIVATRRGADEVGLDDFTTAIERIVAGLEKKNRLLNERERSIVAYHEMGHAIVAESLPGVDRVHKVSIIPRGIGALGYTMQRPTEDRFLMTRQELESKMAVLMGGRAAEHLVFDHTSTGAADDLSKATDIARNMAVRYAMVPDLGPVAYDTEPPSMLGPSGRLQPREYGEATADAIDKAVQGLLQQSFDRARQILEDKRDVLEKGAQLLLERETLDDQALADLMGREEKAGASAAASTS